MIKRILSVLFVITFTISIGTACMRENVNQTSLYAFIDAANAYTQTLDVEQSPIYVEKYGGQYDLKIENGRPVTLIDTAREGPSSLILDADENMAIATGIKEDAGRSLAALQSCLKEGYYADPLYDVSIESIRLIHVQLSEEGIRLFPNAEDIERISVTISTKTVKRSEEQAVRVGRVYMIPNGIELSIWLKNGNRVCYMYGTAYDYTVTTWQNNIWIDVTG